MAERDRSQGFGFVYGNPAHLYRAMLEGLPVDNRMAKIVNCNRDQDIAHQQERSKKVERLLGKIEYLKNQIRKLK